MTTITEILAEAFNHVKADHGVTLRRVDFTGADIEFSASGGFRGKRFVDVGGTRIEIPKDATHVSAHGEYYRLRHSQVCIWHYTNGWNVVKYFNPVEELELIRELQPLPPFEP